MPMSTLVPRYTAEEVRRFPDDHLRYEVIRGELVVTPAPGTVHQRAVLELARRLQEYLKTHVIGERSRHLLKWSSPRTVPSNRTSS